MAGGPESAFLGGLGQGLGNLPYAIADIIRRNRAEEEARRKQERKAAGEFWQYEEEASQPLIGAGGDPAQVQDIRRELERYLTRQNRPGSDEAFVLEMTEPGADPLEAMLRQDPDLVQSPAPWNETAPSLGTAYGMTEDRLSSIQRELEQAQEKLAQQEGSISGMSRLGRQEEQSAFERLLADQNREMLTPLYEAQGLDAPAGGEAPQRTFDPQKYGAAVTQREQLKNTIQSLKDKLKTTQDQRGTVAKAAQKYGSDVNVPGAGFDPQVQLRSQEASELGTMAAARRQLNALGIDRDLTGQAAANYRIAMDRTAPLEEQAQAWQALRDSFGISLPEPVEIYLQGLGVPAADIIGDRMPAQFGNPTGWETMGGMSRGSDPMLDDQMGVGGGEGMGMPTQQGPSFQGAFGDNPFYFPVPDRDLDDPYTRMMMGRSVGREGQRRR